MAVDHGGNIYVADTSNYTVRKVTLSGVVTTLTGSAGLAGGADGIGWVAQFSGTVGQDLDRSGQLSVNDSYRVTKGTPLLAPEPLFGALSMSNGVLTAPVFGLVAGSTVVVESSTNLRDRSPIETNVGSEASQTFSRPIHPDSLAEFLRATVK